MKATISGTATVIRAAIPRRHRSRLARALCRLAGHFPEYHEEERESQGKPTVPLLARWFECTFCGRIDGFEVIRRPESRFEVYLRGRDRV